MSKSFLSKKFYPPKEKFDALPIREQEQLSMLIGSNLVFMLMFLIFGVVLFIFNYKIIGIGGIILLAFFATSLISSKTGHVHTGAWTTTVAIAILTVIECFASPMASTNFLPYRDGFFISAMSVCNYVISLRKRQLQGFFCFAFFVWIATIIIRYHPLFDLNFATATMNIILNSLGVIITNLSILLYDNFTRRVVDRATENEKKTTAALEKLSAIINETTEGLNIGKQLSESTGKAASSVEEIRDLYNYINSETNSLSTEAVTIKDSSYQINDKADQMKQSV